MLDRLRNKWLASGAYQDYSARDLSERRIILGLCLLIGAAIIWGLLWQPLANWSNGEQQRHQTQQSLLEWLQANEQNARNAAKVTPGGAKTDGLLTVVSRTAAQANLQLTRFQPESSGGVSVVLQKQAFNDVIRWLDDLQSNEGVQVMQASLDADPLSGRVNARFSLRR